MHKNTARLNYLPRSRIGLLAFLIHGLFLFELRASDRCAFEPEIVDMLELDPSGTAKSLRLWANGRWATILDDGADFAYQLHIIDLESRREVSLLSAFYTHHVTNADQLIWISADDHSVRRLDLVNGEEQGFGDAINGSFVASDSRVAFVTDFGLLRIVEVASGVTTEIQVDGLNWYSLRLSETHLGYAVKTDTNGDGELSDLDGDVIHFRELATGDEFSTGRPGWFGQVSLPHKVCAMGQKGAAFIASEDLEGEDLNGDGHIEGDVVSWIDFETREVSWTGPPAWPRVSLVIEEPWLVFGVEEWTQDVDLDGDGFTSSAMVLHARNTETGQTRNLGYAACDDCETEEYAISNGWLIAWVDEGDVDLDKDGYTNIALLTHRLEDGRSFFPVAGALPPFAYGAGRVAYHRNRQTTMGQIAGELSVHDLQLNHTWHSELEIPFFDTDLGIGATLTEDRLALVTSEQLNGDLNGDGDGSDRFLQVVDLQPRPAAEPLFYPPVDVGTLGPVGTNEVSGMVAATWHDDVFWVHNDRSDARPRIFALRSSGQVVAEVNITGASHTDWEDIAIGPGPDPALSYIYIADTGTNLDARTVVSLWRVPEPELESLEPGQSLDSAPAVEIPLRLSAGMRDVEALLVDPGSGTQYLLSKLQNTTEVYRVSPEAAGDGVHSTELLGTISLSGLLTAADASPDGTRVLLRTYDQVVVLARDCDAPFETVFRKAPSVLPSAFEPQGESIAWDSAGRDYLTLSEGSAQPIKRMFRKLPQAHCVPSLAPDSPLVFVRGDIARERDRTSAQDINITDAAALSGALAGNLPVSCPDAADVNDDGELNTDDLQQLLRALARGSRLNEPFRESGIDPTADGLRCNDSIANELVSQESRWSYWYGAEPPPAGWKQENFDDSTWPEGSGSIGFGSPELSTVIPREAEALPVIYARTRIVAIEDQAVQGPLVLEMDAAQGFVAYLNGVEVARSGLGETGFDVPPQLPASARGGGTVRRFLICNEPWLREERNSLALEVHGHPSESSRLYFDARLQRLAIEGGHNEPVEPPPVSATLSLEFAPPLVDSGRGTIRVLLDSSAPVVGASFFLEHSRNLRIHEAGPADELTARVASESFIITSLRSVSQTIALSPENFTAPIEAGNAIELARLSFSVNSTEEPAWVQFKERAGVGLERANVLSVAGFHSVVPETIGLEAIDLDRTTFLRGDCNGDGTVDIADPVATLFAIFLGQFEITCSDAADSNDDGAVDISDAIKTLGVLFLGNGAIPLPGLTECGVDPTDDEMGCDAFERCP